MSKIVNHEPLEQAFAKQHGADGVEPTDARSHVHVLVSNLADGVEHGKRCSIEAQEMCSSEEAQALYRAALTIELQKNGQTP